MSRRPFSVWPSLTRGRRSPRRAAARGTSILRNARANTHACHMPIPFILGGLGVGSSTAIHGAAGAGGVAAAEGASKGAQAASVGADAAKVRTCTGVLATGVSWEVREVLLSHSPCRIRARKPWGSSPVRGFARRRTQNFRPVRPCDRNGQLPRGASSQCSPCAPVTRRHSRRWAQT